MSATGAPALNRQQAERLADRMNRECPDKIRFGYLAKHSAIEGAWYVAEYDGQMEHRRIYQEVN